jgi:hypothetical protein
MNTSDVMPFSRGLAGSSFAAHPLYGPDGRLERKGLEQRAFGVDERSHGGEATRQPGRTVDFRTLLAAAIVELDKPGHFCGT